jgi:aminoglycoside phosphotransferase (APT) family kinase protein
MPPGGRLCHARGGRAIGRLHLRSRSPRPYGSAVTGERLQQQLELFLEEKTGVAVRVDRLRRLAGGASRETWAFEAAIGDAAPRALILRRDPAPSSVDSDRRVEFHVLRAARAAGVPVPEALWLGDDPAILGGRFFIMEYVEGETLGRRLLREPAYAQARSVMASQLGAILARIHAIATDQPTLRGLPAPADERCPAAGELTRYEQLYRALAPEPHPVLEMALRWLSARVPSSPRTTLVHGDYRIGNVIFGPEGTRVILDWELAHRGDPMEDVGWICVKAWRFGSPAPVGGIADRAVFHEAYEKACGRRVDAEAARYWEVFGNLKWAVICIAQAKTYLDGAVPSIELASLGRRTAEVEYDLLELIG